ncbi:SIMPL domain-containing protein [Pseudoalteromonas luteoviolacea]|uniref:SIMPL domain-containing protein n=1 Tax=Pseudoalteromonas luteoviolacea TaxID=43657 RepID=UPI00114F63FA|nr:SIMPL domain-containing protein [Pseudoalteromonas luteoviolacea]TQF67680.1 DUF541 domain-containing protein [Pseudoalteromonas luteoviolacea]
MKFFSIVFLLFSVTSYANSSLPDNRHIAVKGYAKITEIPDIARINFEVKSIKNSALEAKKDVDKRVNLLLDGLDKFNVREGDVAASSLLTEPHINYTDDDNEIISGYVATRSLTVTLSKIDQINDFIDFALSVEVNEVEDIDLLSSKARQLREKVKLLAVKNAKEKGQSLAQAFDAELGKVYSINSSSNDSYYEYRTGGDIERITIVGSRVDPDDLAPGRYLQAKISFSATINVVFDLEVE